MADSSAGLHEDPAVLSADLVDRHRAIVSIMEELEAVDWYDQRAAACGDAELAAILGHNRDEEKEHAVMTLEWLRRRDPVLDRQLRTYLFTEAAVLEVEEGATSDGDAPATSSNRAAGPATGSLGIGGLKSADSEGVGV
ncbi:MAG: ferritin [Actinomycetota bacterium]|nr:MAG: ferritin [Actinomycetota bacterium]